MSRANDDLFALNFKLDMPIETGLFQNSLRDTNASGIAYFYYLRFHNYNVITFRISDKRFLVSDIVALTCRICSILSKELLALSYSHSTIS